MSALRTSGPRVSKDWVAGCIMPNQLTQPLQSTDPNLAWTLQRKGHRHTGLRDMSRHVPTVSLKNTREKMTFDGRAGSHKPFPQTRAATQLCTKPDDQTDAIGNRRPLIDKNIPSTASSRDVDIV